MNNILGIIASGVSGLLLSLSHFAVEKQWIAPYIFTIIEFIFWGSFIYMVKNLILPSSKKVVQADGTQIEEKITYSIFDFKKMAWLSVIFGGIMFIFTTARQLKDSLVIGSDAGNSGVAIAKILIPIIAIIFQFIYIRASKIIDYKKLLYYISSIFLALFIGFSFFCINRTGAGVLNQNIIPSISTLNRMFGWMYPSIANIFIGVIGNWPSILFYCLAEIFGSIFLTTFFWQLNSKVVNKSSIVGNNRFVLVFAQIASLAAGYAGDKIGSLFKSYNIFNNIATPYRAFDFFIIVVSLGMLAMFIGNYFLFDTIKSEDSAIDNTSQKKKVSKPSKSFFQIMKENPKIVLFALLTVFYGIIVVFVEQYWKKSVKSSIIERQLTNVSGEMNTYMSWYFRIQSRVSLISSIFLPFILSQFLNWIGFALTTPILVLGGSILTFGIPILCNLLGIHLSWGVKALIGTIVVTILKASKYILFDSSREIFVKHQPEDKGRELKNLEGLISRYGKSMGSYIILLLEGLSLGLGTIGSSWILFAVCSIMSLVWIYTVVSVSEEMQDVSM